jgi:hypothetical protein
LCAWSCIREAERWRLLVPLCACCARETEKAVLCWCLNWAGTRREMPHWANKGSVCYAFRLRFACDWGMVRIYVYMLN